MYEYKFVKIQLVESGSFLNPVLQPLGDYYKVVEEHANEGWRFVQIFSPVTGKSISQLTFFYELIFEREIKSV